MHSALAFHCPAPVSPLHSPVSSLGGTPTLPHHTHPSAARPHLEVYIGAAPHSPYGLHTPALSEDEYYVRDMFTSSPSGSTFGESNSPLPPYTHDLPMLSPYPTSPDTLLYPPTPATSSSSVAPSRRQSRRLSEPACFDEGLVVKGSIAHPYARLYSKKHGAGKRRKMWNHALEKMLFSPQEISTMGAPHRRTIYTASLEAHVDRLHEQLLRYSCEPVPLERLEPYRGLNAKTAKSMVSGLHHDANELKLKILEIERANAALMEKLKAPQTHLH